MTLSQETHHGRQILGGVSYWPTREESARTATAKRELFESLIDPEYREGFVESQVFVGVAFQIRAIRERQGLTQSELGKRAGMAQERISILEDANADSKPTLKSLLRVAIALDVGLEVRFTSFGKLINDSDRTDQDDLAVPSFGEELSDLQSLWGDSPSGALTNARFQWYGSSIHAEEIPRKQPQTEQTYNLRAITAMAL